MEITPWSRIKEELSHRRFRDLCATIATKNNLGNLSQDLYQDVVLLMLEKVEAGNEKLLHAWENGYFDYYMVGTVRNMFWRRRTFIGKYYSNLTGMVEFTEEVTTTATDEVSQVSEEDIEKIVTSCEKALENEHWYNRALFNQHVQGNESLREIESKTRIPRTSIQRTIAETKKRIFTSIKKGAITNETTASVRSDK